MKNTTKEREVYQIKVFEEKGALTSRVYFFLFRIGKYLNLLSFIEFYSVDSLLNFFYIKDMFYWHMLLSEL